MLKSMYEISPLVPLQKRQNDSEFNRTLMQEECANGSHISSTMFGKKEDEEDLEVYFI